MNSEKRRSGPGRDPYFNALLAQQAMTQLHADAAARQLVVDRSNARRDERRARRQEAVLRTWLAAVLRRTADRLAPQPRSAPAGSAGRLTHRSPA